MKEVKPTDRTPIEFNPRPPVQDAFYETTLGPVEPANKGLYWMHSMMTTSFAAITRLTLLPKPGKRYALGHGVTEYALAGVLVVGISIAGLMLLGKNLNTVFGGMMPDPTAKSTSSTVSVANSGGLSTSSDGANASGSLPLDSALSEPLSTTIMTTGVNGSSTMLANALETTANQALQNGTLTPEQYNTLLQLSNQAHQLAQIEAVIEAAAANYQPGTDFLDQVVTYNGTQVTITSLYNQIGYHHDYGVSTMESISDPLNTSAYPETQAFIDLYNSLKNSGALTDPYLNSVVTSISSNILYLNDSMDIALRNILHNNSTPADLEKNTASVITTSGAIVLCTTGDGIDTGSACETTNNGNG